MAYVWLYVYECALLERWVYVLCYVSCLSFFLPIDLRKDNYLHKALDKPIWAFSYLFIYVIKILQNLLSVAE